MKDDKTPINFALIGAAGYIAPRHMKAIKDTGNNLISALDPYDGVGIMDSYFPNADFFIEPERFDRHLDKLRREAMFETEHNKKVDFVSICSPNYMHDSHIRLALRNDAHAICEKPVVLNPWNIDALNVIQNETNRKVYTIFQVRLRLVPVRVSALHASILPFKSMGDHWMYKICGGSFTPAAYLISPEKANRLKPISFHEN